MVEKEEGERRRKTGERRGEEKGENLREENERMIGEVIWRKFEKKRKRMNG